MVQILNERPLPVVRPRPNLLLHCGAQAVKRDQVIDVPTPPSTSTWTPIAHNALVSQVERTLKTNGLVKAIADAEAAIEYAAGLGDTMH